VIASSSSEPWIATAEGVFERVVQRAGVYVKEGLHGRSVPAHFCVLSLDLVPLARSHYERRMPFAFEMDERVDRGRKTRDPARYPTGPKRGETRPGGKAAGTA
jgi:hypothetical protein